MRVACLKTWPVPVPGQCHQERGHDGACVFDPVAVHWWNVRNPSPRLECGLEIEQNASNAIESGGWRGPFYALHRERVTCMACLAAAESER